MFLVSNSGLFSRKKTLTLFLTARVPCLLLPIFVSQLLKDLPVNKAAGSDDITPRLLKESAKEIAPVLASIFQQSLDEGTLLNDWLVANITPLFKKGNKSVPGNYRPVSLTSISCKLLEHIIHSHISRHLEYYNILTPKQHGFRKQHLCVSQLILVVNDWAKDRITVHPVQIVTIWLN